MKYTAGRTDFMEAKDVPPKYREELDAVIDTLVAIHGEPTRKLVKFVMNLESMMGLIIQNTTLNEGVRQEDMADIISKIITDTFVLYAEALGVEPEGLAATLKTAAAMNGIVKHFERELNEERRKKKGS